MVLSSAPRPAERTFTNHKGQRNTTKPSPCLARSTPKTHQEELLLGEHVKLKGLALAVACREHQVRLRARAGLDLCDAAKEPCHASAPPSTLLFINQENPPRHPRILVAREISGARLAVPGGKTRLHSPLSARPCPGFFQKAPADCGYAASTPDRAHYANEAACTRAHAGQRLDEPAQLLVSDCSFTGEETSPLIQPPTCRFVALHNLIRATYGGQLIPRSPGARRRSCGG